MEMKVVVVKMVVDDMISVLLVFILISRNGECGCVLIWKCQFFLINIDLLPFHVGRYCGLQSGRGVSSNGLKPDMFGRKGLLLTSWKRLHCGTEKNTSDLLWESGNYHFQCQGICSLAWSEDSMMMMTRMRKHIDIWGGVGLGVCFHSSHAFDTELATSAQKSSTQLVSNKLWLMIFEDLWLYDLLALMMIMVVL